MNHLTRRDFVKSASAVLPAAAVAGLALPRAALGGFFRSDADTLKIGLIGCGGRGTGAAVQALRADKGNVLVAMSDVFQDRLDNSIKGIREEMGEAGASQIKVTPERMHAGFDSYKNVINSDVDVVLLTSYPHFRPMHYKAAIAAGKHVFAEKPVAVDVPGIRSVLETAAEAKKKNLATLVGFCWRYNAGMRKAFAKVHDGSIGEIVNVQTTYHTGTLQKRPRQPGWSDMEFQMRNWWHFTWISGDHIVEQAIHSIDRMAWALNDKLPVKVTCLGGRAARNGPEHGNVYDHFSAIYEYENGQRAIHSCRQIDNCPSDNTDYVYGTKGSAVINGWTPPFVFRDLKGTKTTVPGSAEDVNNMYQDEHNELFASIRAGKPINDCERGANSTMLAIVARMAAYTGQTIKWEDAMKDTTELKPAKYEFGPMPEVVVPVPGKKA